MRLDTLSLLRCPLCRNHLEIAVRKAVSRTGRLRDGIVRCIACRHDFPVLRWVPRLLPQAELTEDEGCALREWMFGKALSAGVAEIEEERLDSCELRHRLEQKIRTKLNPSNLPPKLRDRVDREVGYRLSHTEEGGKFIRTASAYLSSMPTGIVEIGGGQGGALTALRKAFNAKTALLLDIDPEWVEVAWLRDPDTDVIRADATRIPLADGCADFIFSAATLEHIQNWRCAVREMVRTGKEGLICYNPNAGFPYDFGHLDAPLVTWLPQSDAAKVAFVFHRLRRTGRSLDSIQKELAVTFYIHRRAVVRELESCGADVINAFGEFVRQTVGESYHIRGGRVLSFLRDHPVLLALFIKALVATGTEPNVYLFYRRHKGSVSVGKKE